MCSNAILSDNISVTKAKLLEHSQFLVSLNFAVFRNCAHELHTTITVEHVYSFLHYNTDQHFSVTFFKHTFNYTNQMHNVYTLHTLLYFSYVFRCYIHHHHGELWCSLLKTICYCVAINY